MAPRALAVSLSTVLRPALERRGRAFGSLVAKWSSIAGERLAAETAPERLVTARGGPGGTLHLRVAPGVAPIVQHEAPQLIERINAFLGAGIVARLKLVQAPLAAPPPRRAPRAPARAADPGRVAALAARAESVADPELRAALARLAAVLAGRDGG